MYTPIVEIKATEELHESLELAMALLSTDSLQPFQTELQKLLVEVAFARNLQRRYNDRQMTLRLPA